MTCVVLYACLYLIKQFWIKKKVLSKKKLSSAGFYPRILSVPVICANTMCQTLHSIATVAYSTGFRALVLKINHTSKVVNIILQNMQLSYQACPVLIDTDTAKLAL